MLCAVALVLLLDASASILPPEWRLQVEGHALALENEDVGRAIERNGPVAIAALGFSDEVRPLLGWRVLSGPADARAAAAELRAAPRPAALGTDIAAALWAAMDLLAEAPCRGDREVVDLVTDGEAPEAPVEQARAYAEAQSVQVNALAVGPPAAEAWLRRHAITPDGFALRAEGWAEFAQAFRRKLLVELAMARASHARDLALGYEAASARADLRWGGRDLVLDATPATPGLVSLLCDRRARPDDPLPLPEGARLAPDTLAARRGWCGDALDAAGGRVGSRLWLLQRAKRTEATRRRAELYAREALAWAEAQGLSVTASWQADNRLALLCRIGPAELRVTAEAG